MVHRHALRQLSVVQVKVRHLLTPQRQDEGGGVVEEEAVGKQNPDPWLRRPRRLQQRPGRWLAELQPTRNMDTRFKRLPDIRYSFFFYGLFLFLSPSLWEKVDLSSSSNFRASEISLSFLVYVLTWADLEARQNCR